MINVTIVVRSWWGRKRTHVLSHPSRWADVTSAQYLAYCRLLGGDIKEERVMSAFLGIGRSVVRRLDPFYRYTIGKCLEFANTDEPIARFIVPELLGRKAPEQGLRDVSFAEFIYIDTYYMDYISATAATLNKLVATVYRKASGNRLHFSEDVDDSWVDKLSMAERFSVVKNYGMVRMWLEQSFPHVFAKHEANERGKKSSRKRGENGWIDVFDRIVGDDYANSDKYAERPAVEILRRLNSRIKDQKEQLRKAQALKSKKRK